VYIKGHSSQPTAHVRWYEHGAKTILQETAHPYGLYALAECDSIPVASFMGRCDVRHLKLGDDEPNSYHCK
jgi:DNA (cytosine-5)-methyltransferase 1